jgi:hypothetical protein
MVTAAAGILLASKNGDISAAKLISDTPNVWVLEIEKREVRVSKGDRAGAAASSQHCQRQGTAPYAVPVDLCRRLFHGAGRPRFD